MIYYLKISMKNKYEKQLFINCYTILIPAPFSVTKMCPSHYSKSIMV